MNPFPQTPIPMPTNTYPDAPKPVDDAGSQTSHIHATLDQLQQQKELLRNQIDHLHQMVKERDEYIASLLSHAQKTVQS